MNGNIPELSEALRARFPFKTELHAHSHPASKCSLLSPEELVELYRDLGYSALCITNHLSRSPDRTPSEWLSDWTRAKTLGDRVGLNVILGAEVRLTGGGNHYLLYGISPGELGELWEALSLDIAAFSRLYRGEGRFLCHAHPLREGLTPAEFSLFDGVEAFNVHPDENSRPALAARLVHGQVLTAGTDCHEAHHAGLSALRSRTIPRDGADIARILKSGDCVFELGGSLLLPRV